MACAKPAATLRYPAKSTVRTLGSSVLHMRSTDLGRRTARIPHCHIARNSFTALETHRAPPMHPSQTLATADFFVSTGLPLPRMSQS